MTNRLALIGRHLRFYGYGDASARPAMTLNPVRLWRRRRRLYREALEEAQHLRRRHGPGAITAAATKLERPEITTWGRAVLNRAIKLLRQMP